MFQNDIKVLLAPTYMRLDSSYTSTKTRCDRFRFKVEDN